MYVVVARIKAKSGCGRELERHLREMVDWVTEHENETVTYVCNRSHASPDEYLFYERYPSRQAFEAHAKSDRFRQLAHSIADLLDGPAAIETYDEVVGKL